MTAEARLASAEALHQPRKESSPYSLLSWTYCSCGAYEAFRASDGKMSVGPAKWPCKTLRALQGEEVE